ncbi:hypothetical protein RB2083_865 [Rhodobacteraceae bacterium HTCC2083]|nr:hypothetical protein RB2083_865 [Rhodobacteraceae bacterium HTCC2083]
MSQSILATFCVSRAGLRPFALPELALLINLALNLDYLYTGQSL